MKSKIQDSKYFHPVQSANDMEVARKGKIFNLIPKNNDENGNAKSAVCSLSRPIIKCLNYDLPRAW